MPDLLDLRFSRYDHPDAEALTERAQQYYVDIYGGPDRDPLTVDQFAPPAGGFVLGYSGSEAVAMGGWHFLPSTGALLTLRQAQEKGSDPSTCSGPSTGSGNQSRAQIRRMYVSPRVRGRGYGQAVLRALEQDAAARGATQMILSTGPVQVEAVGLYRASGYTAIEPFGFYGAQSGAIHLGKCLP